MSGRAARVLAQAKVNLFLHVLAQERSGYHQIETLFARLDLADDVLVRTGVRGRSLECAGGECPPGGLGAAEDNLAWRAARAYADATGWPDGFAIEITKRIPVGAGLGGGSADAGAVLRALNAGTPRARLSAAALLRLAGPLGADVPVLCTEAPLSLAWGRGERLLPLPALPARTVWLLVPPFSVRTADAYAWLAAERAERTDTQRAGPEPRALDASRLLSWDGVAEVARNDFEPVLARRHPAIAALVDGLTRQGAVLARVCGSGSAAFGVMARDDDAAAAALSSYDARLIRTRTAARVEQVQVLD